MVSDILIVDDEADIRELVAGILDDEGYETRMACNSDEALAQISERIPKLIFLDIWLQGSCLDGLALLDEIKVRYPSLPVVMISGHGNIETAVSAIKRGAYDFIEKPFKASRLLLVAERTLENSKLKRELSELRERSIETPELLGTSTVMKHLRQVIEKVAPTNSRVMIVGPSGVGKEMVARSIHALSARSNNPFITINASTIAAERMEIELFGSEMEEGKRKIGALEEAHGGILYIDEVACISREIQNKILQVLTNHTFERIGGTKRVKVDVRVISSTAQNLEYLIANGQFREDLFHRLSVVPIAVPPLSARREDIPELVRHFVKKISQQVGIKPREISDEVITILQTHTWPGNVRQLRNNIERLLILARDDDGPITKELLPAEVNDSILHIQMDTDKNIMDLPLREARELFEKRYLMTQIGRLGGNISRTAEFIGMERSALHRKLKMLGIS
ncbi:MAG: Nitrogen regulation protein NtrX [Bartonella clarridgeiae]|uniref:nitrogen assimilation response regulator NtrX n=1 Tax=Bartonella clarridgeiae TaxID=56426 RepID=UPI0023F05FA6|nr:sigma-54 dependent transcriptional regulator [Bartonella clarridgeiae]WCR55138.1 MAG: Nitrogen regulation protein NtrX [Bartonella clarridgeiae]